MCAAPRRHVPVGCCAWLPRHPALTFSMPKEVTHTYRLVFIPVDDVDLKPKGIVQDVKRAIRAMTTITEHRERLCPA